MSPANALPAPTAPIITPGPGFIDVEYGPFNLADIKTRTSSSVPVYSAAPRRSSVSCGFDSRKHTGCLVSLNTCLFATHEGFHRLPSAPVTRQLFRAIYVYGGYR